MKNFREAYWCGCKTLYDAVNKKGVCVQETPQMEKIEVSDEELLRFLGYSVAEK